MTKLIQWSYPSSLNAKQFNLEESGCFTVQTIDQMNQRKAPQAIAGYKKLIDARVFAECMAWPYHWLQSRFDDAMEKMTDPD